MEEDYIDQKLNFDNMSLDQIKEEFQNERDRCITLERDLFKSQTQCRRMEKQVKDLQDLNTLNAKNTNNTSSQFSLPSEFKEKWNEMVTEQILDAFPDFVDKFNVLVPLVHELFITVRESIEGKQMSVIQKIGENLNLFEDGNESGNLQAT